MSLALMSLAEKLASSFPQLLFSHSGDNSGSFWWENREQRDKEFNKKRSWQNEILLLCLAEHQPFVCCGRGRTRPETACGRRRLQSIREVQGTGLGIRTSQQHRKTHVSSCTLGFCWDTLLTRVGSEVSKGGLRGATVCLLFTPAFSRGGSTPTARLSTHL